MTIDHYSEAARLADRAEDWRDFDRYPLSSDERYHLAAVDAALAAVHAQLALVDVQRQIAADEHVLTDAVDGERRTLRVAVKP